MSPDLFTLLADAVANVALTPGLLGFLLFAGWVLGKDALEEYASGAGRAARALGRPWLYAIAVVLPVFLTFTLLSSLSSIVGVAVRGTWLLVAAVGFVVGAIAVLRRPPSAF
jgi:NSS family neurotransmitter:Na+ symporter